MLQGTVSPHIINSFGRPRKIKYYFFSCPLMFNVFVQLFVVKFNLKLKLTAAGFFSISYCCNSKKFQ
jgi:hypothetical protein